MAETVDVAVVGAGPTGLVLAGELALAGVDVVLLERRPTSELLGTRARGFHARTIEVLDQRGIADRFLEAGQTVSVLSFSTTRLELGDFPTRHPYTLGLGQSGVEEILLGWVEELGVPVRRGVEVTGITQDDDGVDVRLADGGTLRATYLVGADGGRSLVRSAAGIEFVGPDASRSHLVAEVEMTEQPPPGIRMDDVGIHATNVLPDGAVGLVVTERELGPSSEPTLDELKQALVAVYGNDFGAHDPRWISRFTDATRQAATYRRGRVLVAGDAAHVHPPTGGQGIGLGVQDAVNLGWKLAQVVQRVSPDSLLDTYESERHPATARVLTNVLAQAQLQRGDARTMAVRDTISDLLESDEPRRRLAGLLSGLDIRYDWGDEHALLGRRVPDLDLTTDDGPTTVFTLLHPARAVLLDLGEPGVLDDVARPWTDRVRHVRARTEGPWELPVVGPVAAPTAVLARPDGHVAWVGQGTAADLAEALTTWCGAADLG
ncbi:FAD-dependent monooxygenase [Angustibacter peucedani]